MALVDVRMKPGEWQIEKIGKSGARYRLRFAGTRFLWVSRLTEYAPMPGRPLYWRRIYTMPKPPLHNPRPRGKLVCEAFRDLALPVNSFCAGRHVHLIVSD